MYRTPVASEIRARRERYSSSIFLARRQLIRERLSDAITEAKDIEDMRTILRVMLNEMWEDGL